MSEESVKDQNRSNVQIEPNPRILTLVTAVWFIIILVSIGTGLSWNISNVVTLNDIGIFNQALVFIPIMLLAQSVYSIPFDKIASVTCYGYPVRNLLPGPKLIPIFFFRIKFYERTVQRNQFSVKVITGEAEGISKDNPLEVQMRVEFVFFLRIQIIDPLLFQVKYVDEDGFWEQIKNTGSKVLTSQVSQIPGVTKLIEQTNEAGLMKKLDSDLKKLCLKGGVNVIESGMSSLELTDDLSDALASIGKIRADAGAKADEIRQIGSAETDIAAMVINKTSEALSVADESAKAAYVGERVLSDKTTVIGTEGVSQIMGLAKVLTGGIKTGDK